MRKTVLSATSLALVMAVGGVVHAITNGDAPEEDHARRMGLLGIGGGAGGGPGASGLVSAPGIPA